MRPTDRAEQQTRHDRALEDISVQAPPPEHDQRQPGLSFIVASRTSKAPRELEDHFGRRGDTIAEGDTAELTRSMGQGPDRRDRRVVWHFEVAARPTRPAHH